MPDKFNNNLSKLSDIYLEEDTHDKRTETSKALDTLIEGKFYDWANRFKNAAKRGGGAKEFADGIQSAYDKFDPTGAADRKWEKAVQDQWRGLGTGGKNTYSNPPVQDHPEISQYSAGSTLFNQAAKSLINKKINKGETLKKVDLMSVGGFDRFRAVQWNRTIRTTGPAGDHGPGTTAWENRLLAAWNRFDDNMKSNYQNDFNLYKKAKEDEWEHRHV